LRIELTQPRGVGALKDVTNERANTNSTYILVRNDFHVLYVPGRLENLTQNILSDSRIKASDIQSALVRLRGGSAHKSPSAIGRHNTPILPHGRCDCRWYGVRILWDDNRGKRGWRHMGVCLSIMPVLITRRTGSRLRRRRQLSGRKGGDVFGHREKDLWWLNYFQEERRKRRDDFKIKAAEKKIQSLWQKSQMRIFKPKFDPRTKNR
jgi:hypothetical protein